MVNKVKKMNEIKEITCFETSDSKIHRNLKLATEHEELLEKYRLDAIECKRIYAENIAKSKEDLVIYIESKSQLAEIADIQAVLKKSIYNLQVKYTKKPTNTRLKKLTKTLKKIETNKLNIQSWARKISELEKQNRGREGFPKHRSYRW